MEKPNLSRKARSLTASAAVAELLKRPGSKYHDDSATSLSHIY
jgi:hypothetical protein